MKDDDAFESRIAEPSEALQTAWAEMQALMRKNNLPCVVYYGDDDPSDRHSEQFAAGLYELMRRFNVSKCISVVEAPVTPNTVVSADSRDDN